jgi:hypothetical protein
MRWGVFAFCPVPDFLQYAVQLGNFGEKIMDVKTFMDMLEGTINSSHFWGAMLVIGFVIVGIYIIANHYRVKEGYE